MSSKHLNIQFYTVKDKSFNAFVENVAVKHKVALILRIRWPFSERKFFMGTNRKKFPQKNRFTTEPVSRGRVFEISYRSIKLKNDSAGLWLFFTIDHYRISKILPLDASSAINLFFWGLLLDSTHAEFSFRKGSANP